MADDRPRGDDAATDSRLTAWVNHAITRRSWTVVAAFIVVTVLLVGGLGGGGGQQAGTDQFTEELDEAEAFEEMQERFSRGTRDTGGSGATMFVSDDRNVLSQPNLERVLEAQVLLEQRDRLRVTSTSSPAGAIARHVDPTADTAERQLRTIRSASQRQITAAIGDAEAAGELGQVSTDLNPDDGTASVLQIGVSFDTPRFADTSDVASIQFRTADVVDSVEGLESGENVVVFADAVIEEEVNRLLTDTSIIVFPAALVLIVFFLVVAYRDPVDLALGIVALIMTLLWTFGFMGYAGIPFSDMLVMVFPLLLAVGIDFGIHIINRYREERLEGADIEEAMGITANQLLAAFLIVTLTTVFSFAANLTSSLGQLRDFGIVASFGVVFTFLIFGIFLPAGKVGFDRLRQGTRFPRFGARPLGQEDSTMGRILGVGTTLARRVPMVIVALALVIGLAGGAYGTGVDTEFSQEAFFPDQERVDRFQELPEPFAPADYTFMTVLEHLEEDFDQGLEGSVTVFVQDPALRSDLALEELDRATRNPPEVFAEEDRRADATSVLSVVESRAAVDPGFGRTVERYDSTGNGVPDREVDQVYERLFDSAHGDRARNYLTYDRSAARIVYQLEVGTDQTEATQAAQTVADRMDMDATATGQLVVYQVVIDRITESAVTSLFVAFLLSAIVLMVAYRWLEGRAVYGVVNLLPILLTVGVLAGSLRYFDIPLTPFNAPILAVSIGLGVDYTVHYMHRFVDEYEERGDLHEALRVTTRGTGGALTGSMLTTVTGLGTLSLALIPLITQFGIMLALGVFLAYLASIVVLPSVIVAWIRVEDRLGSRVPDWLSIKARSGTDPLAVDPSNDDGGDPEPLGS